MNEMLSPKVIEAILLLHSRFNDIDKVSQWLNAPNPNFGCSPMKLIMCGRSHKVLQFIKAALEENEQTQLK